MERRNVKIENLKKSKITLNLLAISGRVVKIVGKGFANISEEELSYIINNSKAIYNGGIRVVDKEKLTESISKEDLETPNCMTDDDIEKFLKKTQKVVGKEIQDIDNFDTVERILKKANELNKSVNMIAIIENRLDELRTL